MGDLFPFHFDTDRSAFEDLGKQNGVTHWEEDILRDALGYQDAQSFRKVIAKAITACCSLNIEQAENFIFKDGKYYLNRFACYLVAMNGDPKKPQVAAAQVYFAAVAETFSSAIEHVGGIDRCLIRDEITEGQKSLSSIAKRHGVQQYSFFMDAGYRGLYNMSLAKVKQRKGLANNKQLFDHIGKAELAANLFRITQTEEKIKSEKIFGQEKLQEAAHGVGRQVRNIMVTNSGSCPEDLPTETPISEVKKTIKGTRKTLDSIDKPKK